MKPDEAVTTKARDLIDGKENEFERIGAIAEFTQRIKYCSIQIGTGRGGGYIPHAAPEILAKAYGDCKDKVNLMRSMLSTVGIESYPMVIYSGDRSYVRPNWASPHQFNHQIIAVKISEETKAPAVTSAGELGRVLLFDPTDPYTPLGYLPAHEQDSLALVITASGSEELLRATVALPETNFNKVDIKIVLTPDGSITGRIREHSKGSSASRNRRLHRGRTDGAYRKLIERWISSGAPGASVSRIEAGDRERGGFFLQVDFSAARYGRTVGPHLLIFRPAIVSHRSVMVLNQPDRKYPVVLEADTYQETVEIEIPPGFSVDELRAPVAVTTEFGSYRAEWRVEGGKLSFSRHLQLDNAVIPSGKYAAVKDFFDRMNAAAQAPVVLVRQ